MILDLARSLNVDVAAEGVETSAQAKYLRGLGCRYGQGYYFGRPATDPISDGYLQAA